MLIPNSALPAIQPILAAVAAAALVFIISVGPSRADSPNSDDRRELAPILQQLSTKNCPEQTSADVQTATDAIVAFKRDIPDPIQQLLVAWLDYSKYYRRMYYVLSVAIIVFGALATALQDEQTWWRRWKTMAAILTTISAALNTTLSPLSDYKKFDDAFVVLNSAKAAYMTNSSVSLCDIGKAVAYGESLIHKGE